MMKIWQRYIQELQRRNPAKWYKYYQMGDA